MGTDEVPAADRARRSEIERRALGGVPALALGLMACGETPSPAVSGPESAPIETSPSASGTGYRVDPFWPRELPDGWLLGNVVGVATDSADNVWIIHRPNSQTGAADTPHVIALGPAGDVVQSWGGPGEGYDWGTQTHGIYVDHQDHVWVGFGGGLPYDLTKPSTTDNAVVLKFTPDGEFLLQIGDFGRGTEGSGSAEFLGQPTDIFVDPETDEVFISDGYTNRRVIVFDANTGLGGHLKTGHRSTRQNRPPRAWRARRSEIYRRPSFARKSMWSLVRQLRGPHLRTWA